MCSNPSVEPSLPKPNNQPLIVTIIVRTCGVPTYPHVQWRSTEENCWILN